MENWHYDIRVNNFVTRQCNEAFCARRGNQLRSAVTRQIIEPTLQQPPLTYFVDIAQQYIVFFTIHSGIDITSRSHRNIVLRRLTAKEK